MNGEKQVFAPRGTRPHGAAVEGPYGAHPPTKTTTERAIFVVCVLIVLAAIFGAFPAVAGESGWVAVTESEDGDRWLLHVPSVSVSKNKRGVWVVTGAVKALHNDGALHNWGVAVTLASCTSDGGEMRMARVDRDRKAFLKWWQKGNGKVYDAIGEWLCYTAVESVKNR